MKTLRNIFAALSIPVIGISFGSVALAEMTVNLGGRIQVDGALYNEDTTALGSGTEFRRARLFAAGDIADDWGYKLQLDFADGDLDMKDVFVQYTGLQGGALKIGQFKAPFSLEELTSSKYITFMERALPNIFATSRRIGVGYQTVRGINTFAASVYGNSAQDNNEDEGLGVAARFTTTPKISDGFLHLGISLAFEEPQTTDAGSDTLRYRARPESHVTSQRLVNSGTLTNVSNITKTGVEAAWVAGRFSAQAEYIRAAVETAMTDLEYDGYYVFASYFPKAGSRAYKNGVFQRVKVENAWEFAVRYSSLDLTDTNGGEQDNITIAANYYVNPYLRFMVNYIMADVKNGINGSEDPDILQFRVSMDFK
ncbi:MAG: porin [Gammaproteobacteria bacterium]|nr:porin [Gammaproteobacteria bacterium]